MYELGWLCLIPVGRHVPPWTWCVFFGVLCWNAWWRVLFYITYYVRVWFEYSATLGLLVYIHSSTFSTGLLYVHEVSYSSSALVPRLHQVEEKKKAEEEAKKVAWNFIGKGGCLKKPCVSLLLGKSDGLAPLIVLLLKHLALVCCS